MPQPKEGKMKIQDLLGSGAQQAGSALQRSGGGIDEARLGRVGNFFQSMTERDPRKRQVKVNENFAADFVLSGLGVAESSSSDDEDFVPDGDDSEGGRRSSRKRKRKETKKKGKANQDSASKHHNGDVKSEDGSQEGSDGSDKDDDDADGSRSSAASSSDDGSSNGSDDDDSDEMDSGEDESMLDSANMTQEEDEPEMDNGVDTATEAEASPAAGPSVKICCVCLSERSFDEDEIVECDSCGISVHEGCYGITNEDSDSVHSQVSSSSTEPWFCDACKAAVQRPVCALCPNSGGIFKESDCGRWVHVVCALYIKGVSFTDPSALRGLTLYELDTEQFGAKPCVLCEDVRLSYTGVCIKCDAGMCKVNFHATCAQRSGLLVDASTMTINALDPDPFYAYCKHHTDKFTIKARRKNYSALLSHYRRMDKIRKSNQDLVCMDLVVATTRTEKKLAKARGRYAQQQEMIRLEAWLPSIRTANLLTKSSSAIKRLIKKGQLQGDCLGVGLPGPEPIPEAFKVDHQAIKRKSHMHPMFSNEFVSYYYSRSGRIAALRREGTNLATISGQLKKNQNAVKLEQQLKTNRLTSLRAKNAVLKDQLSQLHSNLASIASKVRVIVPVPAALRDPLPEGLRSPGRGGGISRLHPQQSTSATTSSPNKNQRRSKSGSAGGTGGMSTSLRPRISNEARQLIPDAESPIGQECDICHKRENFHKLAHCDKCLKFKHITCLSPPLQRVPKKTRFGGWMCSECHEEEMTDEESESVASSPALGGDSKGTKVERKSTLRDRRRGPDKYEPEQRTPPPRKRGRPKKGTSASNIRRGRPSSGSVEGVSLGSSSGTVDRAKSLRVKATLAQAKKRLRNMTSSIDSVATSEDLGQDLATGECQSPQEKPNDVPVKMEEDHKPPSLLMNNSSRISSPPPAKKSTDHKPTIIDIKSPIRYKTPVIVDRQLRSPPPPQLSIPCATAIPLPPPPSLTKSPTSTAPPTASGNSPLVVKIVSSPDGKHSSSLNGPPLRSHLESPPTSSAAKNNGFAPSNRSGSVASSVNQSSPSPTNSTSAPTTPLNHHNSTDSTPSMKLNMSNDTHHHQSPVKAQDQD